MRNLEARHKDGHLFPISLEVRELSGHPLVFAARVTEVDGTSEAVVTVSDKGKILNATGSKLLFGYEERELIGHSFKRISPNVQLKVKMRHRGHRRDGVKMEHMKF